MTDVDLYHDVLAALVGEVREPEAEDYFNRAARQLAGRIGRVTGQVERGERTTDEAKQLMAIYTAEAVDVLSLAHSVDRVRAQAAVNAAVAAAAAVLGKVAGVFLG